MLGEMRNQSAVQDQHLVTALGTAVERGLKTFSNAVVFTPGQVEPVRAARERGLGVFSLNGAVTSLEPSIFDGQLLVRCEVLLLVMDRPTGLLRTLLKGAARGVEVPNGEQGQQVRAMAPRVIEAAVQSAFRNAAAALATIADRPAVKAAVPSAIAPAPPGADQAAASKAVAPAPPGVAVTPVVVDQARKVVAPASPAAAPPAVANHAVADHAAASSKVTPPASPAAAPSAVADKVTPAAQPPPTAAAAPVVVEECTASEAPPAAAETEVESRP
jgi:hypothetical protein